MAAISVRPVALCQVDARNSIDANITTIGTLQLTGHTTNLHLMVSCSHKGTDFGNHPEHCGRVDHCVSHRHCCMVSFLHWYQAVNKGASRGSRSNRGPACSEIGTVP